MFSSNSGGRLPPDLLKLCFADVMSKHRELPNCVSRVNAELFEEGKDRRKRNAEAPRLDMQQEILNRRQLAY